MITPPDVVTQIMMAFPLMLLYEISIWGAIVFGQKETPEEEGEEEEEAPSGSAS
jgi:sec-independent protein translocase protein TatC